MKMDGTKGSGGCESCEVIGSYEKSWTKAETLYVKEKCTKCEVIGNEMATKQSDK